MYILSVFIRIVVLASCEDMVLMLQCKKIKYSTTSVTWFPKQIILMSWPDLGWNDIMPVILWFRLRCTGALKDVCFFAQVAL